MHNTKGPTAPTAAPAFTTVFIAGYGNSLQGHWQRAWFEQTPNSVWVEQSNWDQPNRDEWVACLHAAVERLDGPLVVVAHSLGCNTLVEWVAGLNVSGEAALGSVSSNKVSPCTTPASRNIVGAFLVAYPDVMHASFPDAIKGYSTPPLSPLPFPSLAVVSSTDQYIRDIFQTEFYANAWGCQLVNAGALGHINAASNIGDWQQGKVLYNEFLSQLPIKKN